MRPSRIFAATAFRVALANAAAFALVGVIVFGTLFAISRGRILAQIDRDIEADGHALIATYEDLGPEGLRTTIERRAEVAHSGPDFYILLSADGEFLAGNLPILPISTAWAWVRVPGRIGLGLDDAVLRARGIIFPNGWQLLVGSDPRQLSDLEDTFLGALLWTELGTLLFGLASGYLVSRRVLHGVQTIAEEAGRIGAGELARRIPPLRGSGEIAGIGVAINLMLDRIGSLTGNLRQVTDDVAHDLRTPLSRLRQKLERAGAQANSTEDLRRGVEQALVETDAIIGTFNSMLRISQIEGQDRRAGFTDVDLSGLLARLAEVYEPSAEDTGHILHARIDPGVHVRGDADMLGQMIANLIENALRHTPTGTRLMLTLNAGSGPRLVVADTGPGIPAADRVRVLDRFVRLDASRGTPGTGLGLALVKAVADLHGASLILEDRDPGLQVVLDFPPR